MKATAYQTQTAPRRSYGAPLVMSFFFFSLRHRSTSRLAGTRYSRVTVKLSVFLAQPRIWGIPSTVRFAANRFSSNTKSDASIMKIWRVATHKYLLFYCKNILIYS